MAQGKINKDKVASKDSFDNLKKGAKEAKVEMDSLRMSVELLIQTVTKVKKDLGNIKVVDNKSLKENNSLTAAANNAAAAKIKLDKQIVASQKKIEKGIKDEARLKLNREKAVAKEIRQAKQQERIRQAAIKQAQKLRKTTIDNANAFKILTKQTNSAKNRFQRLAAEFGTTSKQALRAEKTFLRLDKRIRDINTRAKDGTRDVGRYGLAFKGIKSTIGKGLGFLGISAGIAGIGVAIRNTIGIFSGFEKANSNLKAVLSSSFDTMEEGRESMELLSLDARRLGASTAFTASQVVELQTEFAKLGFPTDAILQMTESTLNAAAAMGSELGPTAKLTGSILKAFKLDANQAARVSDVLAKSTAISALDFDKLANSMSTIAPVAKKANFDLESTVTLLGSLSDAGFDASSAATATRNILLNLADSNGKLSKSLKEPVKDLPSLVKGLKQLEAEGTNLGEALELTDRRSVAAFATFLEGTDAILEMDEALRDAGGTAERMAEIQLDNLTGEVTKLTSAWEGFILSLEDGEGQFSKTLQSIVQFANGVISTLTKLNRSSKEVVIDALRETSKARVADLEAQIIDNKTALEKKASDEIEIVESRGERIKGLEKQSADEILKINKELEENLGSARQDTIKERIKVLEGSISAFERENVAVSKNADLILKNQVARDKRNEFRPDFLREQLSDQAKGIIKTTQAFRDEEEELKLLTLLLEDNVEVIEEINTVSIGGSKKRQNETRKLTGLIEVQSKVVSDLREEIQRATSEEEILSLNFELGFEKEELERLNRIATSTREEFEKQELQLIEDGTERRIALERAKSEKLIKLIRSNSKTTVEEKERLILAETLRLENFETNLEIKKGKRALDLDANLAKARVEQSRSGFKTEEAFEKEKAAQFRAIKIKQIDDELELLRIANREEDKLRIENIKEQRESLFEFGKQTASDFSEIQEAILDLLERSLIARSEKTIEGLDAELEASQRHQDRLLAASQKGVVNESLLAEEKKQAEIERRKQEEERKQELITAGFKIFGAFIEQGKSPAEALGETGLILQALPAVINALPTFFSGTEDTGTVSNPLDSNGGRLTVTHDNERIISKENNNKMGGVSNDFVANTIQDVNNGLLRYSGAMQPQAVAIDTNWSSNQKILNEFSSLGNKMDKQTKAIEDKPVFDEIKVDKLLKQVAIIMRSKDKTTRTITKLKI